MKILAIIGSPRKKYSYQIINLIEKKLKENKNIKINYLFLKDYKIKYCKGCGLCKIKNNSCPIKDDITLIMKKMEKADYLILSSPVYVNNVSALTKNFIDRLHFLSFYPKFINKKAVILSTATDFGLNIVLNYLNNNVNTWGYKVIYKIGLIMPYYNYNKIYKKIILNKINILSNKMINQFNQNIKPKIKELILFNNQKQKIKKTKKYFPDPFSYWDKNGWLKYNYFYNIKTNFLIKLFLNFQTIFKKKLI